MATNGTPVGNMVIKVDLDSTGVEKSMTGLQRQLKSSNKAMGAQLSAFNRGEKSAKKYGVLIKGLTNRHRIQARMVEEARSKYQSMSKQYGKNSVKAQKAAQSLNEQIARYQETSRELDNVTAEFKEFQRVQETQSKGWYKVADGMDKFGGKLKATGRRMDETGQSLTRNVSLPLGIVGGLAIKTGADFEAGMSKVEAVSGASADEMKKLEDKAREMGKTSVFSAKEASDAFYYMSLAGWDASESIDGISGVMDLAAASGEDLASVSDIVTDGLTAFGKEAKDSGRMADILAAASANANTDVAGLGKAFEYVAPVAGALGYTMEDVSKAIGLMANAGIKGEKAGTALRTMMTNLSKPTAAMKKEMKKLGISLTDSEGNMKSFDDIMGDLRKSMGGLTKEQQASAAATIFGKEAMSGALAVINASESDYENLTDAIKNSDGAASEMADTMQDNLAGSVKELKSMLEDLFIEAYQNLKPALESIIEKAKDLTQWFGDLSPKTQENIVKFGLLAATAGPVISIMGKLSFGIGSVMQATGTLTKSIGVGKKGLVGAMTAGLTKTGVVGLAIAGVAALSVGVYKLVKHSKEAEEVNLDVAKSLSDQAEELDKSADTFEKLSKKAKISNDELARLNDLNIRISESSNPGEINELQKQYDYLAQKSGLSKDEIKRLFDANKNIIDQTPKVKKSVSDQGNAFAKNTDTVREYIDSLHEATLIELEGQRTAALEREKEITKSIKDDQKDINALKQRLTVYTNAHKLSEEQVAARIKEINGLYRDGNISNKKKEQLMREQTALMDIQSGKYAEAINDIQSQIDKKRESVNKSQEELDKINALNNQMANLVLKQAGINAEGEKGLAQLDKSIAKNTQEIAQLEQKRIKNSELTVEEQKRLDKLKKTNQKQIEAKQYLNDELGLYKDINSLANLKLKKLSKEKQKKIENLGKTIEIKTEEGNIVKKIQQKNDELLEERRRLEANRKKRGANKKKIDEQISAIDQKILLNDSVLEQMLKELGVWDDVKDSIHRGSDEISEKNRKIDQGTSKTRKQGDQIDANNKKSQKGVGIEKKRTKEAGKDVKKEIDVDDNGDVDRLNKEVSKKKDKTVDVSWNPLRSIGSLIPNVIDVGVNFLSNTFGFAKGTPPQGAPGGAAIVGEKGRELIKTPSGATFLSPGKDTMVNLPRGTHVIPNRETEQILKSTPKYATGTNDWQGLFDFERLRNNEFMKLLALVSKSSNRKTSKRGSSGVVDNKHLEKIVDKLSEQVNETKEVITLLVKILAKDNNFYVDNMQLAKVLAKPITEVQQRNEIQNMRAKGR
ncbi:phage tail tape measure protein [Virgibacillus sp. FSP13]